MDCGAVHGTRVPGGWRAWRQGDGAASERAERAGGSEVDDPRVGAVVQNSAVVTELGRKQVDQTIRPAHRAAAPHACAAGAAAVVRTVGGGGAGGHSAAGSPRPPQTQKFRQLGARRQTDRQTEKRTA
eukprot:scaffold80606_cov74-Phaeocystis_antarctica.AAC.2